MTARPPLYHEFNDSTIVRSGIANLTYASPTIYGPGGFKLWPSWSDSLVRSENLWLQVRTPTDITRYGGYDNEVIMIKIRARNTIY
jgi:hypothetical protein